MEFLAAKKPPKPIGFRWRRAQYNLVIRWGIPSINKYLFSSSNVNTIYNLTNSSRRGNRWILGTKKKYKQSERETATISIVNHPNKNHMFISICLYQWKNEQETFQKYNNQTPICKILRTNKQTKKGVKKRLHFQRNCCPGKLEDSL